MSWKLHDEWIDLLQSRHVAIFKNSDTGAEHQLIHLFNVPACPHCGHLQANEQGESVDFQRHKHDTLTALNDHHRKSMRYREKHPHVRLGDGPK